MHNHRKRRGVVAVTSLAVLWTLAPGGCAGTPEPSGTDTATTTTSTGQGGVGGNTATTGGGGSGGALGACGTDCTAINTPDCQVAQCNEQTGVCEVVNDENGVSCDDGLFCTISDSCLDGKCAGGPQNDCGNTAPQCSEVTCDEVTMTCSTAPSMNGSLCQDPNALCVKGATCTNGLCLGGMLDTCFFEPVPDGCHVSECDTLDGVCKPVPGNEGQACIDINDLCTIGKTCGTGVCQGGTPLDCTHLTQGCNLGVCDTVNGMCTAQAVMNGQPCDDLSACTVGETCSNMTCANGTPVTTCEMNGDGCCPMNCNINDDLDCAVQPSCFNIKSSVPSSIDGIYTIDPDSSGPIQQFDVLCDMTQDQGGWTLVARFANQDAANWMLDTGEWWYTRIQPSGAPLSRTTNADMYSVAFHTVVGQELRLSRSDNPNALGLLVTNGGCLSNQTFRSMITSYGNFQNGVVWASDQVLGSCPVTFGNNYTSTAGFMQASCTSNIGAPNTISFWSDWSAGDGAVMMIGGGGTSCLRADHGIGVTEANAASFVFGTSEDDFGDNGASSNSNPYALNLWVR